MNAGFGELKPRGHHIVSSYQDNANDQPHIGQIRVSFEYDRCGSATVIAQQISTDKEDFTFQKWNPNKWSLTDKDSEKTAQPEEEDDHAVAECTTMACCFVCISVNSCFKYHYDENVDFVSDGIKTPKQYFDSRSNELNCKSWIYRFLGAFVVAFSLFLLSTPYIEVLKGSVPLISIMLDSSSVAWLTAQVFAATAAFTLSIFVIAMAWLIYRPAISLSLLCLCGLGIYLLFFLSASGI